MRVESSETLEHVAHKAQVRSPSRFVFELIQISRQFSHRLYRSKTHR